MQSIDPQTNNLRGSSFFLSNPYFKEIQEIQKKIEKIFFDLDIIAFELIALNTLFYERECLSLGVNMLTNSLKISQTTKNDIFELIFFQRDQKIWQKYCRADLCSVSDPLTYWLSRSVLLRGFLEPRFKAPCFVHSIVSETNNLWDSSFFQIIWNLVEISEIQKKIQKIFFPFEIIAFELVSLNTRFYWQRIVVIRRQYVNQ